MRRLLLGGCVYISFCSTFTPSFHTHPQPHLSQASSSCRAQDTTQALAKDYAGNGVVLRGVGMCKLCLYLLGQQVPLRCSALHDRRPTSRIPTPGFRNVSCMYVARYDIEHLLEDMTSQSLHWSYSACSVASMRSANMVNWQFALDQ